MKSSYHHSLIMIAGDSGDGIQLAGQQLSYAHAQYGHIVQTMADFPAEIRAPAGTVHGVSGFQLCFSSTERGITGGTCDYLIVFNPAAFKVTQRYISQDTWVIFDSDKWSEKDLMKAGFDHNPLDGRPHTLSLPLTQIAVNSSPELPPAAAKRNRNLVALGLILWIHDLPLEPAQAWLEQRFASKESRLEAMCRAQQAGYFLGETLEWPAPRIRIEKAQQQPGRYIQVTGNQALVLGMAAAADLWDKSAVLCGYPITPASDLLHSAAQWQHLAAVHCLQAEDEIAAAGMALGASYGGAIGLCCTSGPGMDLKAETLGLAVMAELPLVVIDVQRAGPSTGMPTKAEQSDLLMALFGRHGSCPVPVLAQKRPEHGVEVMLQAIDWAQRARTPVIVLSDALMASATAALRYTPLEGPKKQQNSSYIPPGKNVPMRTLTGLETTPDGAEISYDPANHALQVARRRQKVERLAQEMIPPQKAAVLFISYGSTSMAIKELLLARPHWSVAHLDLVDLYPLPLNFWEILREYEVIVALDLSEGQFAQYLRSYGQGVVQGYGQVHGHQFLADPFESWLRAQSWFELLVGEQAHV